MVCKMIMDTECLLRNEPEHLCETNPTTAIRDARDACAGQLLCALDGAGRAACPTRAVKSAYPFSAGVQLSVHPSRLPELIFCGVHAQSVVRWQTRRA